MKNDGDRRKSEGGSPGIANKIKYTKLTFPATKGRMDRIRILFKEYLSARKSQSAQVPGEINRLTMQPMGIESMSSQVDRLPGRSKTEKVPLERYSYYHGCLHRIDAEEILMAASVGNFLVRASQRTKESFAIVLSIRTINSVAHYQIPVDDTGKFYFNEFSFDSVHELLQFHWKQKVPISLLNEKEVFLIKAVERPDWLFDDNEVQLEPNPLGEGNFGAVYRGTVLTGNQKIQLAVKTLQNPDNKVGREELLREARIMRKLKFQGIVKCIGITVSSEATMVLLEYITGGSMDKYLRKHHLTPAVKIKLLISCAEAVEFMHKCNVIHRDLAARNLLLVTTNDQPDYVKICDFGLSQEKKEFKLAVVQQIPTRWCAPETLQEKIWTQKTDVWSFGVILYEFFHDGAMPYYEVDPLDLNILLNYLKSGKTLKPSKDMPTSVVALWKKIFDLNPALRPSMADVVSNLKDISKNL